MSWFWWIIHNDLLLKENIFIGNNINSHGIDLKNLSLWVFRKLNNACNNIHGVQGMLQVVMLGHSRAHETLDTRPTVLEARFTLSARNCPPPSMPSSGIWWTLRANSDSWIVSPMSPTLETTGWFTSTCFETNFPPSVPKVEKRPTANIRCHTSWFQHLKTYRYCETLGRLDRILTVFWQ